MRRFSASVSALAAALLVSACGGGGMVSEAIDKVNPMNWFGSRSAAPEMAALPALTNSVAVNALWQANIGNSQGCELPDRKSVV
jgi:hypothetical protein